MNTHEINEALEALSRTSRALEDAYEENGGEVTEQTEQLEADLEAVKTLLTTEGVDSLGRWLKSKQDEIEAAKAEEYAAKQRVKALKRTEDYIKGEISRVLIATGTQKVKGTFYGFAQTTSTKSTVNAEALDEAFLDLVTDAARAAGLPSCIDVALKTSTTRLNEAGEEFQNYVEVESHPSVTFSKPRKPKE